MTSEQVSKVILNSQPSSSNGNSVPNIPIFDSGQLKPSTLRQHESLEQLSTNALAPFVPDLSKFENGESIKTYTCSSCGDTFICESNLKFHVNRRSVLITFNCDSCETAQVFYNRCRLLSHIRTHLDKKRTSDITKAILYPIPQILMDGMHKDFMKTLETDDTDEQADMECSNPAKLLEISMDEVEDQEQTLYHLANMSNYNKIEPIKINNPLSNGINKTMQDIENDDDNQKLQCSECRGEFKNVYERNEHFTNGNKLPDKPNPCVKCGMVCPSECSRKSHNRLHMQVSPYVCPECGGNPDRYWENFQKHLRYKCLHYSRAVGYKCKLCGMFSRSLFIFQKHCFTKHMMILLKCSACPMAFKKSKGFANHKEKVHHDDNGDPSYETIYTCMYENCGTILLNQQKAFDHINNHIKGSTCGYGFLFKCPECEFPYETKDSLRKHMQFNHSKVYKQFILDQKDYDKETDEGKIEFNSSKIECLLCHCAFSSQQNYSLHITRSHSYGKQPCVICQAPLRLRAEKIMHAKTHLREKISVCLLCYSKPTPPETLTTHLLSHIVRIKYSTRCIVCGKGLYDSKETFQHLISEHYLKLPQMFDSQKVENTDDKECTDNSDDIDHFLTNNIALNNCLSLPVATAPSCSKISTKQKQQINNDKAPPLKKMKLEFGHCYKCNFVNTVRSVFKAHIVTHKESPSSFQCMECGQCYISEPSLKLHLKINHSIQDVDKYLLAEGAHHTPEKEVVPDLPKSNDLECSVCYEVFTSDALLNTHLRSHGMAFIRTKRVSVA